jgi:hypothetical protein
LLAIGVILHPTTIVDRHTDFKPHPMTDPSNAWGIPTLDLSWQATREDIRSAASPHWLHWGAWVRNTKGKGRAVSFYRYDRHFTALIKHPERLIRFGPSVAVEANFSTFPDQPRWEALGTIGRKRTLSAIWGEAGVKLIVDLNVDAAFSDLSLLGVPFGWSSYATRSHRDLGPEALTSAYNRAADHAANGGVGAERLTFLVFGGGKMIRDLCEAKGWGWIPERSRVVRGTNLEPLAVGT